MTGLGPYPAYRDSGVPWLGKVPGHWAVRRLGTVTSIVNGATPASGTPEYWDGDIPWITPEDLGRLSARTISETARKITREGYGSCGTRLAPRGSIAISTRAPIGHIAILDSSACANQGCRLLAPRGSIVSEYLYFALTSARAELSALGQGTTFPELSRTRLGAFPLPAPCLPEQAAIARFLDHADRRIRGYMLAKQKLIATLDERKQTAIHRAITGQIDVRTGKPYPAYRDSGVAWLGRVPERWTVVALRRVTRSRCDGPFGSGLKSSHYTTDGVRVVRLQNIGHGEFKGANAAYISEEHCAALGDHSVAVGDLLVAGLGDNRHPSGRACVAPATILPAMVKADCFRFRLDTDAVDAQFVAHQLTATAVEASNLLSTGATRQRTNLQTTATRAISFPGVVEQALIVESITRTTADIRSAANIAHRQIEHMKDYRTRLITDVVTGKLDVREAAAALPDTAPA